ncbi:hypothetical protein OIV83_002717 [Microbotryomycetes sp. JL201]|nr:hypothetical protein OIV83_002717 [Microbotryomycetes sp. JL201]
MAKRTVAYAIMCTTALALCCLLTVARGVFSTVGMATSLPSPLYAPLRQHKAVRKLLKRATNHHDQASYEPIRISDKLPSTLHLPSTLLETWDKALSTLTEAAQLETSSSLKRAGLKSSIVGVPGTAIKDQDEADVLQTHLDCMSGQGEWVYDGSGTGKSGLLVHKQEAVYATCDKRFYKGREASADRGAWHVRESLKWRWVPSPSCDLSATSGSSPTERLSRHRFCELIAHKSTLLVGDTPQFSLHDLLLDWTSLKSQTCYGDLYCKEHSLCGDILRSSRSVESGDLDERVFHQLPKPPLAISKREAEALTAPLAHRQGDKYTSPSYGTMLRYRRADGLRHASAQTAPTYVNPSTGIREINQQWMADSRRSDIVIISKAPIPLPLRGHNETWDDLFAPDPALALEEQGLRILEAAWRMTEDVWLPELLDTLRVIRAPPSPLDQLVLYRGGWRSHHDCSTPALPDGDPASAWKAWRTISGDGPPPNTLQPSLSKLLFKTDMVDGKETRSLVNAHTLFFNLQTILQNHVVRTIIAPAFGVPFLDLETSLSVWRSGMVGSSASAPFVGSLVDQSSTRRPASDVGLRSAASGDCSRYCLPSPGGAIEEAFIGGLMSVFERGWASSSDRRLKWVGDGFVNVRERSLDRE